MAARKPDSSVQYVQLDGLVSVDTLSDIFSGFCVLIKIELVYFKDISIIAHVCATDVLKQHYKFINYMCRHVSTTKTV